MTQRCPRCSGGLILRFDRVLRKAGWYCDFCKRWEGSNAA